MSVVPTIRRQLTLFVDEPWRTRLDTLRQVLDPAQASLIGAHVTLCREDEIEKLDGAAIFERVAAWPHGPIGLSFGEPQRFGGHGVLMPCTHGSRPFHALRAWILQAEGVREHAPHLTLAHPRNPIAPGNTEQALAGCPREVELQFSRVALIEQVGSDRWRIIQESTLGRIVYGAGSSDSSHGHTMQITVSTHVDAPLQQVWTAYTTPEDIKLWNAASPDWHTTAASLDLRPGGAFCFRMEAKDGSFGFDFEGHYTKVVPLQRIEYEFGGRSAVVTFANDSRGVEVTVTFDAETTHSEEQQRTGWQAILDNFARHVKGKSAAQ